MSLLGGTVTFLFTDIAGSTRLLQQLGDRQDLEHPERIYQLVFEEDGGSFPPLKTAAPEDRLAQAIQERVHRHIEQSVEAGLTGRGPTRVALSGLVQLVALVAAIVVIVLLLKLAF